jgi:5-methylcytosine-specific restriction endonuclease McrA
MNVSSHRTLILNSTFQPLSVVSYKRAISLIHNNKINVIKNSELLLHSEKEKYFSPKVGILTYFVKAPFARRVALNRENIFIRDFYTCQYCGKPAESVDHIVPRSKGGLHEWSNVVACCKKCNLIKADKLLHQTHLNIKMLPSNPKGNFWIKTIVGSNPDPSWEEYLISA